MPPVLHTPIPKDKIMRPSRLRRSFPACALLLSLATGAVAQDQASGADTFASVMRSAMARMERDMMAPANGDADRDFAAMMIPHHQGAVEMAEAELRFGHDPVLRRLAQGIVVEQQQEIAVMRQALAALLPALPMDAPASSRNTPNAMPMHKGH
jgi:ribosomal protein L16 Arg81 hydroxylase